MTESDWLINVTRAALEHHSNWFVLVRGREVLAEGADLQAALTNADGSTLYVFCEPTPSELDRMQAAGVKLVYCGVSKRVGKRLGVYPPGYFPPVRADHPLKPIKMRRTCEEILDKWVPQW